MAKPEQLALTNPFNLFPDGGEATKVIGIGLAEYAGSGNLAVYLIFANGGGQPISVNFVEKTVTRLDADEFYLKNWSEAKRLAELLIQQGVVAMVSNREPVESGSIRIPVARLVRSALREMTEAEKEQHKS